MKELSQVNRRILIIDDNRAIHDDFGKILAPKHAEALARFEAEEAAIFGDSTGVAEQISFEIHSAFQGKEGIDLVRKSLEEDRPYAIAFIDVRMPPGLDGIETARQILEIDSLIQIVICTAYADYTWNEMFSEIGRYDGVLILKKPFDSVEVLQMAHALAEKWRLHRESRLKMEDLERVVHERAREIQYAKNFVENIIETAHLVFVQLDREGRVQKFNTHACVQTGYAPDEVLGKKWFEQMVPPERLAALWEEWVAVKEEGKPVGILECPLLTKDGRHREFLWQTTVLKKEGKFAGTISFGLDVTERKQLEERLRESQKLETVGKLAGGVAHEFNNLLMGILGQTELLIDEFEEGHPLRSNVLAIQTGAQRAAGLTRQLLAYGRRQLLRLETIDLNRVVGGLEETVRELAGEQVETTFHLAADLHSVKADAKQIEQIILNLVLNAREAMPNGGRLLFATENVVLEKGSELEPDLRPGDYVRVSISDSGRGMTEEVKERAFEPFFTTKGVGEGTGLGLSTCYGISKQSGGHLAVSSDPGKGTTFRLYLPASVEEPDAPAEESLSFDHLGGTETILLMETEPLLREVAVMFLERLGYDVIVAENDWKALSLLDEENLPPVDLLLADAAMVASGGKAFAERVRARHPGARILTTSSDWSSALPREGENGGSNVLRKPFTPVVLAQKVRDILDTER